ncbi:MAG: PQQ-binding-like beta-propeller repeat protein [Halieaceae bacterium]|nr:PQQ-binding-like beta-propeller repeat protein [Halieaceae bacterium]
MPLTHRIPLPTTIPPGGTAVILVDGSIATKDPVQGPGEITPDPWQSKTLQKKKRIEAILFPNQDIRLTFDVDDLHSKEGARLDLTANLALRVQDPVRLVVDVVRDRQELSEDDLAGLLAGTIRTSLQALFKRFSLAELDKKSDLRDWLGTAIKHGLSDDADLLGRSGLAVLGVDAYDLHCTVMDEVRQQKETLYLQASLAESEARGRHLLDEQVLAVFQDHVPLKQDLVEHKEKMADLGEREAAAEQRIQARQRQKQAGHADWGESLSHSAPSIMRPELWREQLGEAVHTAPLCDGERVYVASRAGRVHAFDRISGQPAWTHPLKLATAPGDGMALAEGLLWVPGHDGYLYTIHPESGALKHRLDLGGKLSSAPLVYNGSLILSLDVDARDLREHAGQLVAIDASSGRVQQRWQVSKWGIRAKPVIIRNHVFVGDRRGRFYLLDLHSGHVHQIFDDGGRILGPAQVDESRQQVVVGDLYGQVRALDYSGRQRWSTRLDSPVVGQPLIHHDHIYVGAGDGNVYRLDAASGDRVGEPYTTHGPIATSPLAWGDWIFVGSNDHYLHALDTEEGGAFWTYHSGAPITVTPALTEDGYLFVVDSTGNLNAIRWCLTQYPKAARRMTKANRLVEAMTLWMQAGMADAALETAERAGRLDLVAKIAADLHWYEKAAKSFETLAARRDNKPHKAAMWWATAAEQWRMLGNMERALSCLLQDANARKAPLLTLDQGNRPELTEGKSDAVQVLVRNQTEYLARDIVLTYTGHVKKGGGEAIGHAGSSRPAPGKHPHHAHRFRIGRARPDLAVPGPRLHAPASRHPHDHIICIPATRGPPAFPWPAHWQ